MRIGVDLDGVTLEFQQRWAELYCEYFDAFVPYEALKSWDAVINHTHFGSMSKFHEWFARARGWFNMPWIAGSRGGIDKLIEDGHRVTFVTNRPHLAKPGTQDQLSPIWPDHELYFVEDKSTVECDIYVDDAPKVLDALHRAHNRVIVFDQPWNRHISANPFTPNLARAMGWREVVDIVNHYEEAGLLTLPAKESA